MLNMTHESARCLRAALLGNAAFSGLSGLAFLLADTPIATWMGIGEISLKALGAVLVLFSAYLVFLGRARHLRRDLVTGVIGSDWAWVAASLALVLIRPQWFSVQGIALILAIAVVVTAFALLQARGLRRLAPAGG